MENLKTNDLLSSRTQNLLGNYSSKRKSAESAESKESVDYNEVFARISRQTEQRINKLKSTMTPEQLAKLSTSNRFRQSLNAQSLNAAGDESVKTVKAVSAEEITEKETPVKLSRYNDKINELAARHNVADKFKNRDIEAEIDALISKKLTGTRGESISIRSDLPAVIKNYEVKQGDTLAAIAKDFYKDAFMFKNISAVNEIKAPYKLSEGQNLKIIFHQVRAAENDTLETISEKYTQNKISPKALAKLNQKSEIMPGDTLLIPVQFVESDGAAINTALDTKSGNEAVRSFHLSKHTGDVSLEETKRQIEKYAAQIERLNF